MNEWVKWTVIRANENHIITGTYEDDLRFDVYADADDGELTFQVVVSQKDKLPVQKSFCTWASAIGYIDGVCEGAPIQQDEGDPVLCYGCGADMSDSTVPGIYCDKCEIEAHDY